LAQPAGSVCNNTSSKSGGSALYSQRGEWTKRAASSLNFFPSIASKFYTSTK
jgi:predicted outer membrane repeat protein